MPASSPHCFAAGSPPNAVWREKESHRYNKGVSGRGRDYFSPAHLARLAKLTSYYPQLAGWTAELLADVATTAAPSCAA